MLLVDTSAWIEIFRRSPGFGMQSIGDLDDVVTCLPVVQEVLQGFRDEPAFRIARESCLALPIVESPLGADVFAQAVDLYRAARRQGLTVRSGTDCLIAACALRNGLTIVHHERDFAALARVAPLLLRSLSGTGPVR